MNEPVTAKGKLAWLYRIGVPVAMIVVVIAALSLMNRTKTLAAKSAVFSGATLTFRVYVKENSVYIDVHSLSDGATVGKSMRVASKDEVLPLTARIDVLQSQEAAEFVIGNLRHRYDHKTQSFSQSTLGK